MPTIPIRNKSWRPKVITSFAGGMTYTQNADEEFELFENADVQRDGYFVCRLGSVKVNSNDIGTGMIVGIGFVAAGNSVFQIIAKTGTTWYYTTPPISTVTQVTNLPIALSSFTVPQSPGDEAVRMESALDASNNRLIVCTNPNFTNLIKWDGAAAAATVIATSPANARYLRWHKNRLYVAGVMGESNALYFCDKADVLTWPTDNLMYLPSYGGALTGLESHSGRLFIFCERCIFVLEGDPPLIGEYMVDVLHRHVGCDHPQTITTLGTSTLFVSQGDPMILAGSIQMLSEKTRGRAMGQDAVGVAQRSWAVLTPEFCAIRRSWNTSVGTPAAATVGPDMTFMFERMRYQAWSDWIYPLTTNLGATVPFQAVVAAHSGVGFHAGGGDGNLYFQRVRRMGDYTLYGTPLLMTNDAAAIPVTGAMRTRWFVFGDSASIKQVRRVRVGGSGSNATLTLRVRDRFGVIHAVILATAMALPFRTDLPVVDGVTGYSDYTEVQFELSGDGMICSSLAFEWRTTRFHAGEKLT